LLAGKLRFPSSGSGSEGGFSGFYNSGVLGSGSLGGKSTSAWGTAWLFLLEPIVQYLTMQLSEICNGKWMGGWQVLFAALDLFFFSPGSANLVIREKKRENTDFFGEREMDTILDRYTTYYIGGTDGVPFVCLGKGEVL